MARKGNDNERRVLLDEFWTRKAETLAMAMAAEGLLNSGLCARERDALKCSVAMYPARRAGVPEVKQTASA